MATPVDSSDPLSAALARAAALLPAQGPIDVFIHHNTLHAFEGERFEDAVIHAAELLGTEPFLAESRYREELARGRIGVADIDAVLDREERARSAAPLAGGRVTLRDLHRALLLHAVRLESDAAVRWTLTEGDVLEKLRDDLPEAVRWRLLAEDADGPAGPPGHAPDRDRRASAELWHACVEAVGTSRPAFVPMRLPVRHRDLVRAVSPDLDTDEFVHPLLIRLCAAFLDQGVASWTMPDRDRGLFEAVVALYARPGGPTEPWSGRLPDALAACRGLSAAAVIDAEIARFGVPAADRERFICQTLLALRGWAGMIRQFEERPDRVPTCAVPARLADFLATRLVLDRVAAEWAATRMGIRPQADGSVDLVTFRSELQDRHPPRRGPGMLARAFLLHQVAQLLGLGAGVIRALDENEVLRLEQAIAGFDAVTRRRLFHLAYERRHRITVLDALAAHVPVARAPEAAAPSAQVVLCIDERCESFRRHLEELGLGHETFGTAGFFAVPMYYRGLDDWHASPL